MARKAPVFNPIKFNKDQLRDKIYACWIGKNIGGTLGGPLEGRMELMDIKGYTQQFVGAVENDDLDLSLLTPVAPYPATEMMELINARIEKMQDESLKALLKARIEQCGPQLMYYPAASKLHHAEKAGLLHHTSTMLRMAEKVCEIYDSLDADLLAAGVILHDLCKITEIAADELGMATDYTREGMLIGHLVQGVAELNRLGREMGVKDELLVMLEHMVLSHHDLPEYGSPKPPMFPEAEVLHCLDLMDARIFEMNRALASVQPGSFTERIWSLDRKLYRRTDK